MAKIIPFRAIRPVADKVHLVATRSYVSYSRPNLYRKLHENPYTFIHVINPEFSMGLKAKRGAARFKLVRNKFRDFCERGILRHDETPSFYIYRQIQPKDSFTGLICGISVDDYLNGTIKVHEQTLTRREKLFQKYLDVCNFNAEPVLLTYPDDSGVNEAIELSLQQRPLYDFSTTDHLRHQLWAVDDPKVIDYITSQFTHHESIYIADGHHRSASSALLGKVRRKLNPGYSGQEMFNYIMACLIPESQLSIYDFNRVVKDLNGLTPEAFIERLKADFEVIRQKEMYQPERLHEMSMYLKGKWYALRLRETPDANSVTASLDSQILSEKVLRPLLGIEDLKTDARIEFVSGKVGMDGLAIFADKKKMEVAFGLFPVTTQQLKAVSDAGEIMPPKTTWIEPKLRSGLTIMSLDD
ncbi:MAG: DUF1015 domain-containing protein [Cryomorphaceae bacterium]|nr:MAG: DUF1015 domain-containing protein [Cryomorphaceae bacterium]